MDVNCSSWGWMVMMTAKNSCTILFTKVLDLYIRSYKIVVGYDLADACRCCDGVAISLAVVTLLLLKSF